MRYGWIVAVLVFAGAAHAEAPEGLEFLDPATPQADIAKSDGVLLVDVYAEF